MIHKIKYKFYHFSIALRRLSMLDFNEFVVYYIRGNNLHQLVNISNSFKIILFSTLASQV